MAHALWNYDGACKNIHGHSYKLFITVIGSPIEDVSNPKYGMVIDFGQLKEIVNREIVSLFDHALVISYKAEIKAMKESFQMFDKLLTVDYQPTCENIVVDISNRLISKLPRLIKLHNVRLYETATSYAEWFYSDNHSATL